jgi:4-carboxymuconolactone decarboxylase
VTPMFNAPAMWACSWTGSRSAVRQAIVHSDRCRRDLLRLADEVVFGRVYSRAGLSRRQRSLCTIACLTALREPVQLHAHIAGALNIGVTAREVVEVITQVAMYAGFPAALNAMAVADECFAAAATESGA